MKEISEDLDGSALSIAIVVARFNSVVTERLLAGAREGLLECGVPDASTTVVWVPGSFELPYMARQLAQTQRYDGVVCLGCVIKGETAHNEYINHAVATGLQEVGAQTGVPAIFGVLTVDTLEQALARAGDGSANKGYEAALAAVVMANARNKLGGA
jgi:6,7-dimethyl-8-ribityllumazine synthase